MTTEEAKRALVRSLVESCDDAIESAKRECMLSPATAISRAYYAAFYAASAVFVAEGRHFAKHTAVRAAVHSDLVRANRLPTELGRQFDKLMEARHIADYESQVRKTTEQAHALLQIAQQLADAFKALLPPGALGP